MKVVDGVEVPTCIDCFEYNRYYSMYIDAYCSICKCVFPWSAPICVNFKPKRN